MWLDVVCGSDSPKKQRFSVTSQHISTIFPTLEKCSIPMPLRLAGFHQYRMNAEVLFRCWLVETHRLLVLSRARIIFSSVVGCKPIPRQPVDGYFKL